MRTVTVTLNDLGDLPRARYAALLSPVYRIAFDGETGRPRAVTRESETHQGRVA
jgi:hypothetical protein